MLGEIFFLSFLSTGVFGASIAFIDTEKIHNREKNDFQIRRYNFQREMRYFDNKCQSEITIYSCNFSKLIESFLNARCTDQVKVDVENEFYDLNQLLFLINKNAEIILGDNPQKLTRKDLLNACLEEIIDNLQGRSIDTFNSKDFHHFLKTSKLFTKEVRTSLLKIYKKRKIVKLKNGQKRDIVLLSTPSDQLYIIGTAFDVNNENDYLAIIQRQGFQDKEWNLTALKKCVILCIYANHTRGVTSDYNVAFKLICDIYKNLKKYDEKRFGYPYLESPLMITDYLQNLGISINSAKAKKFFLDDNLTLSNSTNFFDTEITISSIEEKSYGEKIKIKKIGSK